MLVEVAAANRLGDGFHEWIHAGTGEPAGAASQAWNAGAYRWAYGFSMGTPTMLPHSVHDPS